MIPTVGNVSLGWFERSKLRQILDPVLGRLRRRPRCAGVGRVEGARHGQRVHPLAWALRDGEDLRDHAVAGINRGWVGAAKGARIGHTKVPVSFEFLGVVVALRTFLFLCLLASKFRIRKIKRKKNTNCGEKRIYTFRLVVIAAFHCRSPKQLNSTIYILLY